jgi:hypothetical protein
MDGFLQYQRKMLHHTFSTPGGRPVLSWVTCTQKGCYVEVGVTDSHFFVHRSQDLINLCRFLKGPFSTFSLL